MIPGALPPQGLYGSLGQEESAPEQHLNWFSHFLHRTPLWTTVRRYTISFLCNWTFFWSLSKLGSVH